MAPTPTVRVANARYESAAKTLMRAVKRTYPHGTRLWVTMGRARFIAVVEGFYGHWWSNPAEFQVRNTNTGKTRTVSATYGGHNIEVISRPVRR